MSRVCGARQEWQQSRDGLRVSGDDDLLTRRQRFLRFRPVEPNIAHRHRGHATNIPRALTCFTGQPRWDTERAMGSQSRWRSRALGTSLPTTLPPRASPSPSPAKPERGRVWEPSGPARHPTRPSDFALALAGFLMIALAKASFARRSTAREGLGEPSQGSHVNESAPRSIRDARFARAPRPWPPSLDPDGRWPRGDRPVRRWSRCARAPRAWRPARSPA